MATLETQYRNYMEKNPLSEFTFDQWKKWHGVSITKAFDQYYKDKEVPKDRYEVIQTSENHTKIE